MSAMHMWDELGRSSLAPEAELKVVTKCRHHHSRYNGTTKSANENGPLGMVDVCSNNTIIDSAATPLQGWAAEKGENDQKEEFSPLSAWCHGGSRPRA